MNYPPIMYSSLSPASTPGSVARRLSAVPDAGPVDPADLEAARDSFTEHVTPALRDHHNRESHRSFMGALTGGIAGGGLAMLAEPLAEGSIAHALLPFIGTSAGALLGLSAARQGVGDRFVSRISEPAQDAATRTELPPAGIMAWDAYRDDEDEEPATSGGFQNPASQALHAKVGGWGQTLAVAGGGAAAGLLGAQFGGELGDKLAPLVGLAPETAHHVGQYVVGVPLAHAGAALTGAALRPDIARHVSLKNMPALAAGTYNPGAPENQKAANLGHELIALGGGVAGGLIGGTLGGDIGAHAGPLVGMSEESGKRFGEFALGLPMARGSELVARAAMAPELPRLRPVAVPA